MYSLAYLLEYLELGSDEPIMLPVTSKITVQINVHSNFMTNGKSSEQNKTRVNMR